MKLYKDLRNERFDLYVKTTCPHCGEELVINYNEFKRILYKPIEKETGDIDSENIFEMPAKSRILFAEDGTEKILSIERTLEKYGDLSAAELVDLTHKTDSPWNQTSKSSWILYSPIKHDTIKKYHKFEII